ncbi:MAG: hypothetical protein JST48_06585 [Bacteroidetes bacterium]|nr:hypothetical protein [Bacteroidota bacterium]
MKKMLMVWMMIGGTFVFAQNKVDEERMQRDIEITENILSTMIKQQLNRHNFFPLEIQGSYLPGYGVTFRLPSSEFGNFLMLGDNMELEVPIAPSTPGEPMHYTYSYSSSDRGRDEEDRAWNESRRSSNTRSKNLSKARVVTDSVRDKYDLKILEAAKNFIADYGDLLSQLQPNEKIIVTNKGEGGRNRFWIVRSGSIGQQKQNILSVEGLRSDVNQFRQGKITREQLLSKFTIMNNEISDELQPDLELLSSILNRSYSRDLSKTFFCDENVYYDRLKDYGVIYHMQVYASRGRNHDDLYDMPTIGLNDVDQATRDQKVKELYPKFEQTVKDDLLEFGRTLKSLKNDETLSLEVVLTKCKGCSIPSTLELSVKNSVLKDYASGKLGKDAALSKIEIKKGANQ